MARRHVVRRVLGALLLGSVCASAGLLAGCFLGAAAPTAPPDFLWRAERSFDVDGVHAPGPWLEEPGGTPVPRLPSKRMSRSGVVHLEPEPGLLDELLAVLDVRRRRHVARYRAVATSYAPELPPSWTWIGYEREYVREAVSR